MNKSKHKKVSNSIKKFNIKRIAIIVFASGVLLCVSYFVFCQYLYLRSVVKQAEIVPIRELVIRSAESMKSDAPVDHRTGDIYFPQAKLYIPSTQNPRDYFYSYYPKDVASDQDELNVADDSTTGQSRSALYSVQNIEEFFAKVPRFTACSRGVKLVYNKIYDNPDLFLAKEVILENGRVLFMYTEPACDQSADLIDILSTIKPY